MAVASDISGSVTCVGPGLGLIVAAAFVSAVGRHMLTVISFVGKLHIAPSSSVAAVGSVGIDWLPDLGVNSIKIVGTSCCLPSSDWFRSSFFPFGSSRLDVGPRSSFSIPSCACGYQNKACYGTHGSKTFGCRQ